MVDSKRGPRKDLLGIPVDCLTIQEAVERLRLLLLDAQKHIVTTLNPEFVVEAQRDFEFKTILNKADLSLPDGVGVQLAVGAPERLAGVDVIAQFFKAASLQGLTLRIFLLGGRDGAAELAAKVLKKRYPRVEIAGTYEGEAGKEADKETTKAVKPCDILLVAYGHGKQEKWIARNLPRLPVKVAIGVGGTFDYLSGRVPRAPRFVRKAGLEWLFRLIKQPWRIKRQWKLLVFAWLVLQQKFK